MVVQLVFFTVALTLPPLLCYSRIGIVISAFGASDSRVLSLGSGTKSLWKLNALAHLSRLIVQMYCRVVPLRRTTKTEIWIYF